MRGSIVMLGVQASGKGTQGALLSKALGIPHVAAGDVLRAMKTRTDTFAREVQAIMQRGDRLADADINNVMSGSLSSVAIIDGYPRSTGQAEHLDRIRHVMLAINLDIPDEEAYRRVAERRAREGRADDTPEALAVRLKHHHASAPAVLAYYEKQGTLVTIDAHRPISEVAEEIAALVHSKQ